MPSQLDHDRAVRFIAATRFPFPGQADWPADNLTVTNESERRCAIRTPAGEHYPDIVIVTDKGVVRVVGEVELEVGEAQARIWAWSSAACDNKTKTGVKHFFVYVPKGLAQRALDLLEQHRISYAGVRTWEVDEEGRIRISPVVTTGDPKDHRESLSD
jgi:hypothetical protein